jgi:predicted secreted hydrolase
MDRNNTGRARSHPLKNDGNPAKAGMRSSLSRGTADPGFRRDDGPGGSGRTSLAHLAVAVIAVFLLAAHPAPAGEADGFQSVSGPCDFIFPRDHGAHPGFRTEWWYYTGHLKAAGGGAFGFQLTFFRRQLQPSDNRRDWPAPASAWRTQQIYLAHAALTDITGARHVMAEKMSRQTLGLAGAATDGGRTRIFLHDWQALIANGEHRLRMNAPEFGLDLRLTPVKPPVAHGQQGYSRKGDRPEQASCYYSFSRLAARGRVRLEGREQAVSGTAWMDHEFSTAPLAEGITGWDWFSIQLDDGTDLMLFRLRLADGGLHPASSGTLIGPDGASRHLPREAMRIRPLRRWTSPQSGAVYPLDWEITLPGEALALTVRAALDAQEMLTTGSTGVTYWEGSISVQGRAGEKPLSGRGYLELTGYADPDAPPL